MKLFTINKKPKVSEKQTIGITKNKTNIFKNIRNPKNDKDSLEKARLLCRFDKLIEMYKNKSFLQMSLFQTDYEKEIVFWNIEDKYCKYCFKKKSFNCRICGEPICKKCTKEIPLKDFDPKLYFSLILCKGLCFNEILKYQKL